MSEQNSAQSMRSNAKGLALRTRLTTAGWAYGMVAACLFGSSFIQRVNLLILVSAGMTALVGVGVWHMRRRVRPLAAGRRLPSEAFAGQPIEVGVVVDNPSSRAVHALVVADRFADSTSPPPVAKLPAVPARGAARAVYRIPALPRGRHRLASLQLSTAMPLGLFTTSRSIPDACELLVYPRLGELTEAWRQVVGRASFSPTNFRPAPDRAQEEFHGVREYRFGDNPRHIHWRSTARRGQLVVREFEALAARDVALVVDPFADDPDDKNQRTAVETIVSFAATALVDLCKRGARQGGAVLLTIAGSEPATVFGPASSKTMARGLAALATCSSSKRDDWLRAVETAPMRQLAVAQIWFLGTQPRPVSEAFTARSGPKVGAAVRSVVYGDREYHRFFRFARVAKADPRPTTNGVPVR